MDRDETVDSAEQRTPPNTDAQTRRFSAFISYSHADEQFVRRLHRRLEGYRLPRRLPNTHGAAAGHRLKPLFRDNDEMSASYDLSAAVREAIAASDHMIVVGSPASATSLWVGREIEEFRALHGDQGILATIIAGSSETAFHPALHGRPGGPKLSPLAADFRPEGGGQRLALLRLVAALAGVHLDDLVHRDAQRRMRQMALGGASVAAALGLIGVAGFVALSERNAADTERTRGQAFVESMLNARKALKASGQPIDVQARITSDALAAYCKQALSKLTDKGLQQCARDLQDKGELSEKRGDLTVARQQFIQARRMTMALLAAKPNDPKRIFAQAQSEYFVGFIDWQKGDGAAAKVGLEAYASLVDRLLKIDPKNRAWRGSGLC